ncbi:MAG: hypothetical protein JNK49_10845 [Planctomycetes bacterium]|nr:hypothetical protein [Planctomycetota bacterium]
MLHNLPLILAVAGCGTALTAQAFTMTEGNFRATNGAPTVTHAPCGLALRSDALNTNHGFEHWWYYRVAGDTRELSLRAVGPTSGGLAPFQTHGDRDFGDVDLRGLLRANVDLDIYATGPASGVFTSRVTLTNLSAAPVTLDLFAYTDLDIAGTSGNDVCTGTSNTHVVTDWTGVQVEIRAAGADASDVGAYPSIRNRLTNTSVDNLANVLPPFSGDYTGAFQWSNRTLQPREELSFTVVFAVDTAASRVPEVAHYGAGSTTAAQISTDTLPLQDNSGLRFLGVHLDGAQPNAPVGLLTNLASAPGLPFGGLTLWVDPTAPATFPIGITNPSGRTSYVFVIPSGPYFTGLPFYHQYFWVNPASSNGVGDYSAGLQTRLGRL